MIRLLTPVALVFCIAAAALGQQPRVVNGNVQPQALSGALDRAIRDRASSSEAMWIGYAVPAANPDSQMCCWSDGANVTCNLEPGATASAAGAAGATGPVRLDSGDMFFVLFRSEKGQITRIRTFSEDCPLDAGGRTIHWLTGVNAGDSVSLLSAHATSSIRRIADAALAAISMHADASALDALVSFARSASSTHVRGQALFWLSQRAGQKAVGTIAEAIEKDPETDVKRRAVFALSQLPKGEGVPLLINVARTNPNPVVKKQAIFWLGQSKDARALKFFEEILFK